MIRRQMLLAIVLITCATGISRAQDAPAKRDNFTIAGRPAFVLEPPISSRSDGPMPWVWYAPTFANRLPGPEENWMIGRFHDAGIAIAGIDVGESYGSPQGRAIYQELYEELTKKRGYGDKPVLLARSRGGLMLYNWAVEHPESVSGIAGIYPVCNLISYPGLDKAAGAYELTATGLEAKLSEHNPIARLAPLADAKVPILHIHGDQDTLVPLEANSAELAKRYKALGGPIEVDVIKGQGHNMWTGWFQSQKLTEFAIEKVLGRPAAKRPNVIVILGDDMGIDSVSAFNNKMGMQTPAIDQLAREGYSFTDAHSTSGVCSPTRYSVLTGRYNWRSRLKRGIVGKWERPLIHEQRLTLPQMFREQGYDTACIGKWHLGWDWPKTGGGTTEKLAEIDFSASVKGGPVDRGFDYYFGDDVPNWPPYAWRENDRILGKLTTEMKAGAMVGVNAGPSVDNWDFRAVLKEYSQRWSAYIRERANHERPFFLYVPMPSPHTPIAPHQDFRGRSTVSEYADFLIQTDDAVGEILRALRETKLEENTLVIFTCDNGTSPQANFSKLDEAGVHLNEHWRGWKADAYEGGHRVPFVVRWPGHVEAGSQSAQTITLADIMATCADVIDYEMPDSAAEDSVSLLPTLLGEESGALHQLAVHQSGSGHFAVRQGKWKLLFCHGSGGGAHLVRRRQSSKSCLPCNSMTSKQIPRKRTTCSQTIPKLSSS